MYLIHGPLILFVMKPILVQAVKTPINSLVMVFLAGLYCGLIFVLARLISPVMYFTRSRRKVKDQRIKDIGSGFSVQGSGLKDISKKGSSAVGG